MEEDLVEELGDGLGGKRQVTAKYQRTLQSDGTFLRPRHAFGVTGGVRDNLAFVTMPDPHAEIGGLMTDYLVYPVGQQVKSGWLTSLLRRLS